MLNIRTLNLAEGAEHENTTVEGSIASHTFAAGSLTPGKLYIAQGAVVVNDNNSTDTSTLRVRFGSSSTVTSNTAVAASAAINVEDADFAGALIYIHCQTTTRIVISTLLSAPDAAGVEAAYWHYAEVTIDQATEYYLDLTNDWSVAHADNEIAAAAWAVIEAV